MEMDVTLNLTPNIPPEVTLSRSASPDFTALTVGAFYQRSLNENWNINLEGDIGAGSSVSTWNLQMLFQRELQSGNLVSTGLRVMSIDFDDQLPSGELFTMDVIMSGLIFAFTWK